METKEKIARVQKQIEMLKKELKGARGDFKKDLQNKIFELQKQLESLMAINPHGGKRPTISDYFKKNPPKPPTGTPPKTLPR